MYRKNLITCTITKKISKNSGLFRRSKRSWKKSNKNSLIHQIINYDSDNIAGLSIFVLLSYCVLIVYSIIVDSAMSKQHNLTIYFLFIPVGYLAYLKVLDLRANPQQILPNKPPQIRYL